MAEGFDFVLVAAAKFTRAPALVDRATGRAISFTELEILTRERAHGLLARGSKIGATYGPTSVEHVLLLLAGWRCGVTMFPLSPRWPEERARELARRTGADIVDISEMLSGPVRPFQNDLSAPATVLATSGSSGESKRVVHSLAGHLANARGSQSKLPLRPGCGWLLNLPLYHVSGLSVLFRCLTEGAVIVLPGAGEFETAIVDERVTHGSVVSTQLRSLLEKGVDLRHLRALLAGGGPIPAKWVNAGIDAGYPLHLTYGMTEAASQITTTARLTESAESFSVGNANAEIKVRVSEVGEIQIRSQSLCLGYLQDNGALLSARGEDGWFATRDTGSLDAVGNLWVTGRVDRMFISGGENIHPEAIEQALESLPSVRRAVVMPIADETYGHRPMAFVAWKHRLETEATLAELLTRFPKFMVPVRFEKWPSEVALESAKIPLEFFRERVRQFDAGGENDANLHAS